MYLRCKDLEALPNLLRLLERIGVYNPSLGKKTLNFGDVDSTIFLFFNEHLSGTRKKMWRDLRRYDQMLGYDDIWTDLVLTGDLLALWKQANCSMRRLLWQ